MHPLVEERERLQPLLLHFRGYLERKKVLQHAGDQVLRDDFQAPGFDGYLHVGFQHFFERCHGLIESPQAEKRHERHENQQDGEAAADFEGDACPPEPRPGEPSSHRQTTSFP